MSDQTITIYGHSDDCVEVDGKVPGCDEYGPCERCGGWTAHKRLVAGETASLRADVERLTRERSDEPRGFAVFSDADHPDTLRKRIADTEAKWKADVQRLLADVERLAKERDDAIAQRDALQRHYDAAGPEHNLLALLDLYDEARTKAANLGNDAKRMMGTFSEIEVLLGVADEDYIDHAESVRALVEERDPLLAENARLQGEIAQHIAFRAEVNDALPRPFGVTVIGAIKALRDELDARPAITEDDIDAIREGIYGDDRMSRKTLEAALAALSRVAHASQPKGDGGSDA